MGRCGGELGSGVDRPGQRHTDAEDRGRNGLSLLQLWREDDGHSWALFQVGNPKAARDYLDGAAAVFAAQAGVTATDVHFVETV